MSTDQFSIPGEAVELLVGVCVGVQPMSGWSHLLLLITPPPHASMELENSQPSDWLVGISKAGCQSSVVVGVGKEGDIYGSSGG